MGNNPLLIAFIKEFSRWAASIDSRFNYVCSDVEFFHQLVELKLLAFFLKNKTVLISFQFFSLLMQQSSLLNDIFFLFYHFRKMLLKVFCTVICWNWAITFLNNLLFQCEKFFYLVANLHLENRRSTFCRFFFYF